MTAEQEIAEKMFKLFVNRDDAYAEQFLDKKTNKKGFRCVKKKITPELIEKHLKDQEFLGIYNVLPEKNCVPWGCLDFDKNTKEDFDNSQKLFFKIKQEGLHPLMELSGGGNYKNHIWIFTKECSAEDMQNYLKHISKKIKVKPNEIFPKQTEVKKEDFGNLVKLPLGKHLETKRKSVFLDDDFNIMDLENIDKRLQFHLDNLDVIPKIIIEEKEFVSSEKPKVPQGKCAFLDYCLANKLPEGKRHEVISRNMSLYLADNPEREKLKKLYVETQEGKEKELDNYLKKIDEKGKENYPFSCGELVNYQKEFNIPFQCMDCEKYREHKEEQTEYQKIKLAELNAGLVNEVVEVDCQITGEQSQKAIPEKILITCETCGNKKVFNSLDNFEPFISDRQMKSILQDFKDSFMCSCAYKEDQRPYKTCKINNYIDYSIIYARDLLDRESLTAVKRYDPKRVYIISKTLPNAKTINIKGKVIIEPKTKNLSIVCSEIKPLENQIEDFKVTEEFKENSKKYFTKNEEIHKQINPDIVGKLRDIAKQSIILQLHSPCKIHDITRTKLIRGGLNGVFYGDTKCGKSDLSKDITQKGCMPLGEYTTCETGGRTGFLYTIDKDRNALIWGSLALNDMGLVVLDGLQSMHSEELGEFREAIEGQEIIVKRSISGDALARTRILASLNPNKPMVNYIYKCQAILDSYVFSKSPDVTRFDYYIPFSLRDVSSKEIAHRKSGEKPIPKDIFMQHIYWVWSKKPEQIIYTDSAVSKINDLSEVFIETYSLEILPIVHNGVRDIITRLSVAMACQMHSTDESHEKVIVETEHVEKATRWYKEVLDLLELSKYKQDIEGKSELTDNDCIAISKELGETEWTILEEIKHEGKSSTQLSEILEKHVKTIKEHYVVLKKHNLIETKTGKGVCLSIRGVKFIRWGMLDAGNIVTNNVTKKIDSNEKGYYVTKILKDSTPKNPEKEIDFNDSGIKEELEK